MAKMKKLLDLANLQSFGDVAAEDDSVLDYFVTTDIIDRLVTGKSHVILGRKGSGKTAVVRFLSESPSYKAFSKALKLKSYPWNVHATRRDSGASDVESYVASWRYLISVEVAQVAFAAAEDRGAKSADAKSIATFLTKNYGSTSAKLEDLIRPDRVVVEGSLEPTVLGCKLGSIDFARSSNNNRFGLEISALSEALVAAALRLATELRMPHLLLNFDELDQGLAEFDEQRRLMFVGLVLASRDIRVLCRDSAVAIRPLVYLRSDLWDVLKFSDKNKITQTHSIQIEWDEERLKELVNARLSAKLEDGAKWEDIEDGGTMRGTQAKFSHILARTFLRPRDIIKFLNAALNQAKSRGTRPLQFENDDINNAREEYSRYLKQELDDEITPHFADWDTALRTLSMIQTVTFQRDQFEDAYKQHLRKSDMSVDDALELLYRFSVVGYERRFGGGGSGWTFNYANPEAGFDKLATRFKVHLGLKEYAKLREERQPTY
jgi:hypothetical protein